MLATGFLCCVVSALAAPAPKAKPPVLDLLPFATDVQVTDPLDVALTFHNTTGADIVAKGSGIWPGGKTLRFEMKHQDDAKFTTMRLEFYEKSHSDTRDRDAIYPADAEFATQVTLGSIGAKRSAFPKAGKWTLRATVTTADGPLTTREVAITVHPAPKLRKEVDPEDGFEQHIMYLVMLGRGRIPLHRLDEVRKLDTLDADSYSALLVRRALLVAAYRTAAAGADRAKAADAVVEYAKQLTPHVRDHLYLDLAELMAVEKDFAEASGLLNKIETPYDTISDLRKRVEKRK